MSAPQASAQLNNKGVTKTLMTKTNTASKKYGLFNKTILRKTGKFKVTRAFKTRDEARYIKSTYANPLNIGILNLSTGKIVR